MSEIDDIPTDEDLPQADTANLLAPVESEVIALSEETPASVLLQVYDRCRFYGGEIKRIQKLCEAAMIAKINRDGPIEVRPGVRYIVGTVKTTKCENVPAAVETILGAVNGDFSRFCGVLSSNALKHGAAKKILTPEQYATFFKTTTKEKLEGGEPADKLQRLDEAFMK